MYYFQYVILDIISLLLNVVLLGQNEVSLIFTYLFAFTLCKLHSKIFLPLNFYDKPIDSVRTFLMQKRQVQQAANDHDQSGLEEERLTAESITIGSRCEVTLPNAPPRRGLVMFVGK